MNMTLKENKETISLHCFPNLSDNTNHHLQKLKPTFQALPQDPQHPNGGEGSGEQHS